jgi:hypothetical protein
MRDQFIPIWMDFSKSMVANVDEDVNNIEICIVSMNSFGSASFGKILFL